MPIIKGAEAARVLRVVSQFERHPNSARVSLQPRRNVTARDSIGVYIGKADAAIAKGASGTVSVWAGTPGSETDTGTNITSCYNRTAAIASGDWVSVTYVNGFPYVAPLECDE